MTIAATILAQLGNNKFIAMTGAKNLMGLGDGLSFQIGRNSSKANRVKIKLAADDTYTVSFARYAKLDVKQLEQFDGIYCDQLREVFTRYTGLETSL